MSLILTPCLSGTVQELVDAMEASEALDYEKVKVTILNLLDLLEEAYHKRFRELRVRTSASPHAIAHKMKRQLNWEQLYNQGKAQDRASNVGSATAKAPPSKSAENLRKVMHWMEITPRPWLHGDQTPAPCSKEESHPRGEQMSASDVARRVIFRKAAQWRTTPGQVHSWPAIRTSPHDSLGGFSPAEIIYGKSLRGPLELLKAQWEGAVQESSMPVAQYVYDLQLKLKAIRDLATEHLQDAQQTYYHDLKSRHFQVGDSVLVLDPIKHNKLQVHWLGPGVMNKIGAC
ncbi:hypothetical protein JRQ81_013636 [Phrynocephalus forsythii]|uniref:Uncharacterized protein n=1 Tax=Phrynocephalus forsythii TaxID=171643 RepID=A0A9Q0XZI6_9SAUR|nr:hypothetical protein JRQ81_013636 [Phrynocephalus forsythii]